MMWYIPVELCCLVCLGIIPHLWDILANQSISVKTTEPSPCLSKATYIEGANDIELSDSETWAGPIKIRQWVDGFNDPNYNKKNTYVYNFGYNGRNYDIINSDGTYKQRYSDSRNDGFTTADVWYISYGAPKNFAVPQIYYDATTPGYANMPNQWWHVALWAFNQPDGKYMSFAGLLSRDGVPSAGTQATLKADAAYNSFKNELAKDSRTKQDSFGYPTIMNN